jgi:hypothetical protein
VSAPRRARRSCSSPTSARRPCACSARCGCTWASGWV